MIELVVMIVFCLFMRCGIDVIVLMLFGLVSERFVFWRLFVVSLFSRVLVIRLLNVLRNCGNVSRFVLWMMGIISVWLLFFFLMLMVMLRLILLLLSMCGLLLILVKCVVIIGIDFVVVCVIVCVIRCVKEMWKSAFLSCLWWLLSIEIVSVWNDVVVGIVCDLFM